MSGSRLSPALLGDSLAEATGYAVYRVHVLLAEAPPADDAADLADRVIYSLAKDAVRTARASVAAFKRAGFFDPKRGAEIVVRCTLRGLLATQKEA